MRFIEIANPEEQLALWKLVSDKMWAAFGQQAQQQPNPVPMQQIATLPPNSTAKPKSRTPAKTVGKSKSTPVKVHKPKKAPMAPAPKPLPMPKPQQLTPAQVSKQQTQQQQQLAHHIHQAMIRKPPTSTNLQSIQPKAYGVTTVEPMNNSYSERDMDELVLHRREDPFKSIGDQKLL
jgi:hypothetical protein